MMFSSPPATSTSDVDSSAFVSAREDDAFFSAREEEEEAARSPSLNGSSSTAPPAKQPQRLAFLDLFKGLLITIMAVDHVKHSFAGPAQDPVPFERFFVAADYDGSVAWWWTRFVTHVCAAGFTFAMGYGLHFFVRSRIAAGWSRGRVLRHYVIRGALLVAIEQVLFWYMFVVQCVAGRAQWADWMFITGILTMLGANVVLASAVVVAAWPWLNQRCRWLGDAVVAALVVVLPVAGWFAVPPSVPAPSWVNPALAIALVSWWWPHVVVADAVLPWLPVCLLGSLVAAKMDSSRVALPLAAAGLAAVFVALRVPFAVGMMAFGSYRPILQPLSAYSFFGMSKYPPSITYLCFWLSVDLLLLWGLRFVPLTWLAMPPLRQLLVFGSAPLFFYCLHLVVYTLLAAPFAPSFSTTLAGIWLLWMFGLVLCYWPTKMYAKFKATTARDSAWRFF